ncbi:Cupin 2, conserved barrel [Methanospirillum hungatei JF-1]|uniref:Cupin 2, conserved barrel n=1 Tax=Methanospirillum hungatei JF-1 (strain ATCC 27890 / DSM 864 / NBRC 100397 / JF-1) TaxID=323259 RepID=Q2FL17_METHJ|nr:cupin domain-containing protein [Methanospirillum hungatei]ABD41306.1 Cupin 2, conserved barrel [Methanospirillum hungatei JF-1]
MSAMSVLFRITLINILFIASFSGISFADGSWEGSEGILITSDAWDEVRYDEYTTIFDVVSLLDRMGGLSLGSNLSVQVFTSEDGGILSPDAILPVPEVIYITEGSLRLNVDDEEVLAERGQAVYIPPQTIRRFENAANDTLQFISVIDWASPAGEIHSSNENKTIQEIFNHQEPLNQTKVVYEDMIPALELGDSGTNRTFRFSRFVHPREGPYDITYDLGTARIDAGSGIPDHYIDGRYQLITVLTGSGNISVGCHEYAVSRNDIIYVAPGAVMNLTASDDMNLLVLTNPYYMEMFDWSMPYACDYLY